MSDEKKYFVVSDIHGFAKELKIGLKNAGFNKRNKNHFLIVLGDVFDRGPSALEVYNFLMSIPKKRRIFIKGNHETLYNELLEKDFPDSYDFTNCTVDTFFQIASEDPTLLDMSTYNYDEQLYLKMSEKVWKSVVEKVKNHPITKWIQSSEWKNYYELDNYILVHSFIPLSLDEYYYPKWRDASNEQWKDACWGCPWKLYKEGLFKEEEAKGKTLVCGHWHTSDFYKNLEGVYDGGSKIYRSKGLIAIDGGVYRSFFGLIHEQNVLII